jgi:hypothetical protein
MLAPDLVVLPVSVVVSVALLVLCNQPAYAQQATARLSGTVADTSGASVPGASVTALKTGLGMSIPTGDDGAFSFPALPGRLLSADGGEKRVFDLRADGNCADGRPGGHRTREPESELGNSASDRDGQRRHADDEYWSGYQRFNSGPSSSMPSTLVNFNAPGNTLGTGTFGEITSTAGPLNGMFRVLHFAGKIMF